jgi:hypothetical protein
VDGVVRLARSSSVNRLQCRGSGGVRVSVAATVFDGSFPLVSERERRFVLLVFLPGSGVCFRLDGSFDNPEYGYRDRYVDVVCQQTTGCEAEACVIRFKIVLSSRRELRRIPGESFIFFCFLVWRDRNRCDSPWSR